MDFIVIWAPWQPTSFSFVVQGNFTRLLLVHGTRSNPFHLCPSLPKATAFRLGVGNDE